MLDGLSPRVRGNHSTSAGMSSSIRSIPARAGEPTRRRRRGRPDRVYPRACGGTLQVAALTQQRGGLSPRVRGNLVGRRRDGDDAGSIPARAGEPSHSGRLRRPAPVYPRACGGTIPQRSPSQASTGLSPRVRGNHPTAVAFAGQHRSIPARAGEPSSPVTPLAPTAVYPRACGGTMLLDGDAFEALGLSPRVRGNPGQRLCRPDRRRSIPARAGEPSTARCSRT